MDHEDSAESRKDAKLGRIPLKQVRVKRGEAPRATNQVNFLVPYLDLFWRLDDAELGRVAGVDADTVAGLRKQVIEVERALERYVDLLPRLSDTELVRLTGATEKTIRFWRLCQPRVPSRDLASRAGAAASTPSKDPVESSAPTPTPAKRKKPDARLPTGKSAPQDTSRPRTTPGPDAEDRDARVEINPAAQATVDSMMTFSGAPFPGYDDGESESRPPPDEISLSDVEAPDVGRA
jgi:hypothetical protein